MGLCGNFTEICTQESPDSNICKLSEVLATLQDLVPHKTVKKCDGYHFYGACNFLTLWHCTCNKYNYSDQSYEDYIAVNKGSALFSKISEVAQFSVSNSYAWIRKNNPTVTFVTMYIHACK